MDPVGELRGLLVGACFPWEGDLLLREGDKLTGDRAWKVVLTGDRQGVGGVRLSPGDGGTMLAGAMLFIPALQCIALRQALLPVPPVVAHWTWTLPSRGLGEGGRGTSAQAVGAPRLRARLLYTPVLQLGDLGLPAWISGAGAGPDRSPLHVLHSVVLSEGKEGLQLAMEAEGGRVYLSFCWERSAGKEVRRHVSLTNSSSSGYNPTAKPQPG